MLSAIRFRIDIMTTPITGPARWSKGRVCPVFNFFSLDIIYYPVSAIMWVWYKAFAFILGPSNFFAWALSVM